MNTTTVTFSLISFSSSQFYFYIFFFTFVSLSVSHSFSHYYFDQPRFLKIALAPKWQHDSLATLSSDGVKWLSTRIEIKKIFLNRFDFFLNNLHLFIFEWFLYFNFPKVLNYIHHFYHFFFFLRRKWNVPRCSNLSRYIRIFYGIVVF